MPNWATGTLKIRGAKDEIMKFCKEILGELESNIGTVEWSFGEDISDEFEPDTLIASVNDEPHLCIWLKESNRNFVDMDSEVPYYWDLSRKEIEGTNKYKYQTAFYIYNLDKKDDSFDDCLVVFPFKSAWGLREEYFEDLTRKYKLEIKIYVVEQGVGYYSEECFKGGKIIKGDWGPKEDDHDKSYGAFVWECPFPFLGG